MAKRRQLQFLTIRLLVFPFFSTAFVGHSSGNRLKFHQAKSNTQPPSTFVASSPTALSLSSDDHHDDDVFPKFINANHVEETNDVASLSLVSALAMAPIVAATVFAVPIPAWAASWDTIPSALWSYGHLLALLGMMGTVVAQKIIVEPGMSQEDEGTVGMLNIAYSLALFLLLGTGYFRVMDFGKGATFYFQETTFWLKMAFTGVQGGLALFKSITLVKRGMDQSSYQPMSDKLAGRMQQILNAEITGLVSIPLVAAMMARGVGYFDGFPWPAGVGLTVLATGGASFFYAKQALTWED